MKKITSEAMVRLLGNFCQAHPLAPVFKAGYSYDVGDFSQDAAYPLLFLRLPLFYSATAERASQAIVVCNFEIQVLTRIQQQARADFDRLRQIDEMVGIAADLYSLLAGNDAWRMGLFAQSFQVESEIETATPDEPVGCRATFALASTQNDLACYIEELPSLIDLYSC